MSLNMLIEFGDPFDYSAADFEKWCREVAFKRFTFSVDTDSCERIWHCNIWHRQFPIVN